MSENNNIERVRVLGVYVDPLKIDRAVTRTSRYQEKHKFEYILFVNTAAALAGQTEAYFEDYIENAALVLPGDMNLEEAVEVRKWMEEGVLYQAEYFRRLLSKLNLQHAACFILMEKEKQLQKLQNIIHEKYNRLKVEAIQWTEETSMDRVVNKINSHTPDLLIMCGRHEKMSTFLKEHGCKINAGLCICAEEIVTDGKTNIDEGAYATKFQKFWREIGGTISQLLHDFLFKKQMKQEKQLEEAVEQDNNVLE